MLQVWHLSEIKALPPGFTQTGDEKCRKIIMEDLDVLFLRIWPRLTELYLLITGHGRG